MRNINAAPALLMTVGLAAGCTAMQGGHEGLPPTTVANTIPQQCLNVSAQAMKSAEDLLNAPEDPHSIVSAKGQKGSYGVDNQKVSDFQLKLARQLGLHVYQAPQEVLNAASSEIILPDNYLSASAKPGFNHIFKAAQRFIGQYGVTLRIGNNSDNYANGAKPPSVKDLETNQAKVAVADVASAFNMIPQEYIALAGLKQIVMVSGTDKENVDAYVYATKHDGKVYVDISDIEDGFISSHVVDHEIYHLIDDRTCGDTDMFLDRGFQALNNGKNVYTGKMFSNNYPSMTSNETTQFLINQTNRYYKYRDSGDYRDACSLAQQELAYTSNFVAYSDYHPNVAEDKAEIGAEIPDPYGYHNMLNPQYGLISGKFRLLFSRLYELSPKVATYFARVSDRYNPATQDDLANCGKPLQSTGQ